MSNPFLEGFAYLTEAKTQDAALHNLVIRNESCVLVKPQSANHGFQTFVGRPQLLGKLLDGQQGIGHYTNQYRMVIAISARRARSRLSVVTISDICSVLTAFMPDARIISTAFNAPLRLT